MRLVARCLFAHGNITTGEIELLRSTLPWECHPICDPHGYLESTKFGGKTITLYDQGAVQLGSMNEVESSCFEVCRGFQ